ncbi:MAG: DNA-processing protein DprA [Lentisphaeria bacterium]|nr:DNA-processing protein DprA [Lentisphaeria bacterium]
MSRDLVMDTRAAYLILNLLPGIGPGKVKQLLACFASAEEIFTRPESALLRVPGIGARLASVIRNWQKHCDLEAELRLAQAAGVYIVTQEDAAYPALLKEIYDPPICLYVRGELEALQRCRQSLAIVGSRHTSNYGLQMAASLAAAAACAGWTVVSGLARGIDTAAHRAVVQAGGCTVAVIGSGLCRLYPPENQGLAEQICAAGGAVVSEFPLQQPPDKRNFPMRNRIISGMSKGTLVVEAGLYSGSLITAGQAVAQNRSVFAVPGRADSPFSRGCHNLLRDGARLVETFLDVQEEFSMLPNLQIKAAEQAADEAREQTVLLSSLEYDIWQKIGEEKPGIDDLLAQCPEPPSKILGSLLIMEIKQVLRQLPGKRVQRIPNKKVELQED